MTLLFVLIISYFIWLMCKSFKDGRTLTDKRQKFWAYLTTCFSIIAIILCITGIYSVQSKSLTEFKQKKIDMFQEPYPEHKIVLIYNTSESGVVKSVDSCEIKEVTFLDQEHKKISLDEAEHAVYAICKKGVK